MDILQNIIRNNASLIISLVLGLFLIFLIWIIALQVQLSKIKRKNREFFSESSIKNIEELILGQTKNLKLLDKDIQELYNISNQINNLASRGFHKFGLVRFNPFKDVGGDQSFSLALLNGKNNGIVVSSLFTREGARVYSKSIIEGHSEKHPLTQEEKEAIGQAMANQKLK
jgi:hypothetical protein